VARDAFPLAWLREQCSVFWQRAAAGFHRVWGAGAPTGRGGLPSLQWAYLGEAWLTGAWLVGAYLENANLSGAHLRGAMLAGTNLSGANLDGADLQGALLMSANLEGACGLTLKQLAQVATLHEAHLDPPLLAQIQRHYPRLLEWPSDQVLDTFKTHFRAVERPL